MVDENRAATKAVLALRSVPEGSPDGGPEMAEEPAQKVDGVGPFVGFVATGVALSLILVSSLAGARPGMSFLGAIGVSFLLGMAVWGPVAFFAMFPGFWVFRRIRRAIRGRRWLNLFGTAIAALAVAAVGACGGALAFGFVVGPDDGVLGFLAFASLLFALGSLGALLSGLMFYWREDWAVG